MCGLIIVVATAGKFGGAFLAARLSGYGNRESAILGTLMNTRGLMELIVLNIGLELGVISPTLFTMLVIMALVTTMATSPVLAVLQRVRPGSDQGQTILNQPDPSYAFSRRRLAAMRSIWDRIFRLVASSRRKSRS